MLTQYDNSLLYVCGEGAIKINAVYYTQWNASPSSLLLLSRIIYINQKFPKKYL
jgi:hypothetical protein